MSHFHSVTISVNLENRELNMLIKKYIKLQYMTFLHGQYNVCLQQEILSDI